MTDLHLGTFAQIRDEFGKLGWSLETQDFYRKLNQLRLVTNAVKHGEGDPEPGFGEVPAAVLALQSRQLPHSRGYAHCTHRSQHARAHARALQGICRSRRGLLEGSAELGSDLIRKFRGQLPVLGGCAGESNRNRGRFFGPKQCRGELGHRWPARAPTVSVQPLRLTRR